MFYAPKRPYPTQTCVVIFMPWAVCSILLKYMIIIYTKPFILTIFSTMLTCRLACLARPAQQFWIRLQAVFVLCKGVLRLGRAWARQILLHTLDGLSLGEWCGCQMWWVWVTLWTRLRWQPSWYARVQFLLCKSKPKCTQPSDQHECAAWVKTSGPVSQPQPSDIRTFCALVMQSSKDSIPINAWALRACPRDQSTDNTEGGVCAAFGLFSTPGNE